MNNRENRDWNAEKEDLKKRFALLTNNDMMPEDSQNKELWEKLKIMFGTTNEESNLPQSDL